jgi:hypothetical protein
MKIKPLFLVVLAMAVAVLVSCGTKEKAVKEESVQEDEEWVALDAFHAVMADVYHPLKDSGNLQPIKERSQELAAEADNLADAKLPAKVDTEEVKAMISALQESVHGINDEVKSGASDDQIKGLLEGAHTLFHHIQEEWYGGHEGDKH